MKRFASLLIVIAALAAGLYAQFGLGRVRGAIDRAKGKAEPVTKRVEKAADAYTAWTPEEEQTIGGATAAKMIAVFGLYDSPSLTRYANLVGSTVAQFASRKVPYRFAILDTDIVGAYSLPGGYIFITRHAIEGMNSEAELAGVLGHEIYHVSERHLETEIRSKKSSAWAVEETKNKIQGLVPNYAKDAEKWGEATFQDVLNSGLSREKEDAADEEGMQLAVKAGYAPNGLMTFLKRMDAAQTQQPRAFGQLLSTHPPFKDRVANLELFVNGAPPGGKVLDARFNAALAAANK